MEKWADFGISAVRYNEERTNIEKVFIHEDKGEKIGIIVGAIVGAIIVGLLAVILSFMGMGVMTM